MTIASEITRIKTNIENTYTALEEKGATMPEVQNSDNLAETVGSVSAESGRNKTFKIVDDIIDEVLKQDYTNNDNLLECFNDWHLGSTVTNSTLRACTRANNSGFYGYVFSEDSPNIIYVSCNCLKVSQGASVEEIGTLYSSNFIFKIDFTNCINKYLVFSADNITNNSTPKLSFNVDNISNAYSYKYVLKYVVYSNITVTDSKYIGEDKYILNNGGSKIYIFDCLGAGLSKYLEDFTVKNMLVKFNLSTRDQIYFPWEIVNPINKLSVKNFLDIVTDAEYGVTALSQSTTKNIITNAIYNVNISSCYSFPFILDCSQMPESTNTWRITSSNYTSSNYSATTPYELFLILPNMNVYWTQSEPISINSIIFLAENAPEVTNKKLTIGSFNIAYANSVDASIMTNLTNKGWTVV